MAGRLYVGVDLGKGFHQVSVVDEKKEQVGEPFRIQRGSGGIEKILRQLRLYGAKPGDLVVTIEATGSYWNELVFALASRGCRVYLAQPKKVHDLRKFYADHTKTDITGPVWVPSGNEQMLLRLCRLRWKYRCRIADLKRRISTLSEMVMPGLDKVMPVRYSKSARLFLRRYLSPKKARRVGRRRLIEILSKAAWGKFSEKKAEKLWECIENAPELGWQADDLLLEVGVQLDELEMLELQVDRLDHRIAELYSEVDPDQKLMQIPGIGEFLAAALTASIGDVSRFPSTKHLVSWAGLAPRVKSSAGRTKTGQAITKKGSPFLRAWAYLGASCARQYDPELKAYYHGIRDRGKHYNVALCATAARLLERAYRTLSQGGVNKKESLDQKICSG